MNKVWNPGKRKCNNGGSTLIVVLVVVAFIAVLGTVSISAASVNLRMKTVDRQTKRTFYTCEAAQDEIYAQMGMLSMSALEAAYNNVMEEYITSSNKDKEDPELTFQIDDAAEEKLSKLFVEGILRGKAEDGSVLPGSLTGDDGAAIPTAVGVFVDYSEVCTNTLRRQLNDSIGVTEADAANRGNGKPYVKSVGSIRCNYHNGTPKAYDVTVGGIVLEYLDTATNYISAISFDLQFAVPSADLMQTVIHQYQEGTLPEFGESCLIADRQLTVDSTGKNVRITGNVYAGTDGITVAKDSGVTFTGTNIVAGATDGSGNCIGGDVVVEGNALLQTTAGSNLWCRNILLPEKVNGLSSFGAQVTLNGTTLVQNDLKINGASSKVNIYGDYAGYSYDGVSVEEEVSPSKPIAAVKDNSSAVIVNGAYSNLNIANSNLLLGGHAYIIWNQGKDEASVQDADRVYKMGESLAFRGNQEAYLVPPVYCKDSTGAALSNPYSNSTGGSIVLNDSIKTELTTNFFAKDLLNAETPYITTVVAGENYLYLNFQRESLKTEYMQRVLMTDEEFASTYPSLNTVEAIFSRQYIRGLITVNMQDLMQQSFGADVNSTAAVSAGVIVKASAASETDSSRILSSQVNVPTPTDFMSLMSLDLKNRYTMLTRRMTMPKAYQWGSNDYSGGIDANYKATDTPSGMLVDKSKISAGAGSYGTGEYRVIIADGSYTYDGKDGGDNIRGGVIVARGSVTISADFDGLVIALSDGNGSGGTVTSGRIKVTNNAVVSADRDAGNIIAGVVAQIDSDAEANKLLNVFKTARQTTQLGGVAGGQPAESSLSELSYRDLVAVNNWNKTNAALNAGTEAATTD